MTDESRRPNIKPEGGVDPLVCPRGHHSVSLRTNWFTCRTCENQGREECSWDRSELVDLRDEEPPLRNEGNVATDGGPEEEGTERQFTESDLPDLPTEDRLHLQRQFSLHGRERVVGWLRAKVSLPTRLELAQLNGVDEDAHYEWVADRYVESDTACDGGESDGE